MATIVCANCGEKRRYPNSFPFVFEARCDLCFAREVCGLPSAMASSEGELRRWREESARGRVEMRRRFKDAVPSRITLPAMPLPSFSLSLPIPGEAEPAQLEEPQGHPYREASTRVDAGLRPPKSPPLPAIGSLLEALRRGEAPLVRSWWDMLRELVLLG